MDSNMSTYLPRVQTLIYDFEDFKMAIDPEMETVKKCRDVTVPNILT